MSTKFLCAILLTFSSCAFAMAQTSAFTYQGKLSDGGTAANGTYDVQFKLFDTATTGTGTQQGSTITNPTVAVTNGIFTVQLDFGAAVFSGAPRFLEIGVRLAGNPNPYNVLAPRQAVTATPYAVRSLNSSVADTLSSSCVGCISSTQVGSVNGSAVTGTIPVASVPAGSSNYLQNTTSQQAASNFNISGNGTAGGTLSGNTVNTATQYNIGGARTLSAPGTANLFAGMLAGNVNSGTNNSFFGAAVGSGNTTGSHNAFFGWQAGLSNTSGGGNTFVGDLAGQANATGSNNTAIGAGADIGITGGNALNFATAIGAGAVATFSNGIVLGRANDVVSIPGNLGVSGEISARSLTLTSVTALILPHAVSNTALGLDAAVTPSNLTFATALGAGTVASQSNSIFLGRPDGSDAVRIPGPVVINGSLVVGTLGSAGSMSVCLNSANRFAPCSSSLRYKTSVQPFIGGLDVVRRLRPIAFNWRDGGMRDVGFAAEEVNAIEPLLTTRNDKGEIEGVKYAQLTTVLVNAVKDLQSQIETLRVQNAALSSRLRSIGKARQRKVSSFPRR